jgi:acyl-coenzyme A synthetase/AMP-(fatty) acid ligase
MFYTSILSAPPLTALKKGFPKVRARAQKGPSEHTNAMADCTESTQTGDGAERDEHGYICIKGRVDGSSFTSFFFSLI